MISIFVPIVNKTNSMKNMILKMIAFIVLANFVGTMHGKKKEVFPDGTPIPQWFYETNPVNIDQLGKKYVVTPQFFRSVFMGSNCLPGTSWNYLKSMKIT